MSRYIRICLVDKVELEEIEDYFQCPKCFRPFEEQGDVFGVWDTQKHKLIYIADVETGWLQVNHGSSSDNLWDTMKHLSTEEDRVVSAGLFSLGGNQTLPGVHSPEIKSDEN